MKIIIGGIPGTAMPPSSFSEGQAGTIVAYLRSLASSPTTGMLKGDAARGQALFTGKGQCQNCHSVAGVGARGGPSLSEVGGSRRAIELQRAIVDPSADIRSDHRPARVVTRDGATITGRLLNQDTFTVQLLDNSGAAPAARQVRDPRARDPEGVSDAVLQGQARTRRRSPISSPT